MQGAAPRSSEFEVSADCDLEGLRSLEPEWWDLWERVEDPHPFQTPAWVCNWISQWGLSKELRVFTARQGGRLVGVVPLYRENGTDDYLTAGTGISDYLGGCLEEHAAAPLLDRILETLGSNQVTLGGLPYHTPWMGVAPPVGTLTQQSIQDYCPRVHLPETMDELRSGLSHRFAQNLAYAQRRLESEFEVRYSRAEGHQDGVMLVDTCVHLHEQRWSAQGKRGVLHDPQVREFHRSVARELQQRGILRLEVLHLNGLPAAAFYGFRCHRTTCYYLGGFDPGYRRFSPGSILIERAIRTALEEGCEWFDFLRGQEPYKYAWGAVDAATWRRTFTRSPELSGKE